MDFGFVRIYYLKEIAKHRANVPGRKCTRDFLSGLPTREGCEASKEGCRPSVHEGMHDF